MNSKTKKGQNIRDVGGTFAPSATMIPRGFKLIEGSLEAKLPTIWTVETQSREEAERREKIRRKKR